MDAVKLYFVGGKGVKECEIDLKTIMCQNMLFSVIKMANFKVFYELYFPAFLETYRFFNLITPYTYIMKLHLIA